MATALLGLGSNLGNREETLRSALTAIDALPDVRVRRASELYKTRPLGGPAGQDEFFNAAATIETKTPPLQLLDEMQDIETRHGRTPASERWAARPLDIDLLIYDDEVMEMPMLTLPHPRMTYRRFVLQPAVEIAPRTLHPVIGWPIERLLLHLNSASDRVAIVSPSAKYRQFFADFIAKKFNARPAERSTFATAEQFWPAAFSMWLDVTPSSSDATTTTFGEANSPGAVPRPPRNTALPYAAAAFPKLSILLDAESDSPQVAKSQWSAIVRRPGRGPTLRLQETEAATFQTEIAAAIKAVWS
jgi:2-amino-4-hydroxy-6-hydroxymethyldihydropteridine diphosphokinase